MTFSQRARGAIGVLAALVLAVPLALVTSAPAHAADPLRREVSREKPLFLIFHYGNEPATIPQQWAKVPDDLKENSVIVIGAPNSARYIPDTVNYLEAQAASAQSAGIPFMLQILSGETPAADRFPTSWLRTFAENHSMMQGYNFAELYNSAQFTGSNHSQYLADVYDVVVDEGLYFVWTDTNIFGTGGTQMQWLQDNANLLSKLRATPQNAVFMNKESFGDTDSDALNLGMWLSNSVGNWGSASDWWHWGINGYGLLYGGGTQTWKDISQYPDAMTIQSMLKVVSQGGTAFKTEAQWFTNVSSGERVATYEYGIIPFLRDIKSGAIRIPTKAEVLEQNKTVFKGSVYNDSIMWNTNNSNIFPRTGRYGILPMVPNTIANSDLTMFDNITTTGQNRAYFDALYPQEVLSSDTFLLRNKQTWYWMNSAENRYGWARSTFVPKQSGASAIGIAGHNHTFAVLTEAGDTTSVIVNNYRLNKSNVRTETLYGTAPGTDFDAAKMYSYIKDYMTVKLDANGVPVKDADGDVLTASNRKLNDRSARDIRTTKFTVDGTWNGGAPQVTYAADTTATRPYTHTETWDATNKRLTVAVTHNGLVKFTIKANGPGGPTVANLAQGKTATQSSEWNSTLTAGRAVDGNVNGNFASGSVSHTLETGTSNPWWKVDLGSATPIGEIEIWNRTDCCADRLAGYKVEVLDASSNVVWSKTDAGWPNSAAVIDAAGVSGRYVRVSLAGTGKILSLAEVKVHPPLTNLALGKTATQSSTYTDPVAGASVASKAVDGNTDGAYLNGSVTATNFQTSPWWKVDLGATVTVNQIKVWNRTDAVVNRLNGYLVEVLDASEQVVWSNDYEAGHPDEWERFLTGGVTGRYVRVSIPGGNQLLSLAEVMVG